MGKDQLSYLLDNVSGLEKNICQVKFLLKKLEMIASWFEYFEILQYKIPTEEKQMCNILSPPNAKLWEPQIVPQF